MDASLTIRFNNLCFEAVKMAEMASLSKEGYFMALQMIRETCNTQENMKTNEYTDQKGYSSQKGNKRVSANETDCLPSEGIVKNPTRAIVKGRQSNNRMLSTLEKNTTKNLRKCRMCNKLVNHDSRL